MGKDVFKTADLYLASAVKILLNITPEFEIVNGKVLFVFPISEGLYQAMTDFNSGVSLNAYEFTETIKRLRSEMFMRRSQKK